VIKSRRTLFQMEEIPCFFRGEIREFTEGEADQKRRKAIMPIDR